MATVYSGEVAVGTYNRIRIKCDYSGTSATLTIQFRRTSSYTGTWGDTNATLTFNGQTKGAAYSYSGKVGTSWVNLRGAISGYSISTSGGTYNWTFNNPGGSSVLGCSGSITVPSQAVAPTTPTVSASNPGTTNSNSVTWGTTSMGTPSSGTVYLYGGTSASPTTQLTTKTTTGNSTYTHSSLAANTKYYYRARANNGQWSNYSSDATAITRAAAPSASVGTRTVNSIQINYSTAADGNAYSKSIQYSLDGTNWSTGSTVSTGSASSGSYKITGRASNTSYSIRTRVNTTAGATTGSTLTAVTLPAAPSISVQSVATDGATISYSTAADGGAYTKTLSYSIDGGSTWTTITTAGGSATSGTFTLSNLTTATTYTVQVRSVTTAGTSTSSLSFVTVLAPDRMYGGTTSNLTTRITNFYGPVSDSSVKAIKIYGSVGGVTRIFYRKYGS